jgi:hypothetical protein
MLARAIVVGLGAAVFLGSPLLRGPAYAAEPRDGRIGRDEVISRAEDWVFRDVPYSKTAKATDPEGISYRTDCSGFISMTWRLSASRTTDDLDDVATYLSNKKSMKAGDILMWDGSGNDGDAVLFKEWTDSTHDHMQVFEQSGSHGMWFHTAALGDYGAFSAYRYTRIFDNVAGTELAGPSTSGCNNDYVTLVRLTGMRNVEISTSTCILYDSVANSLTGWLVVKWWPYANTADDDSTTIGTRFDGFGAHAQLQQDNVTRREATCWMAGDLNAAASGTRGCFVSLGSPGAAPGRWTAGCTGTRTTTARVGTGRTTSWVAPAHNVNDRRSPVRSAPRP